MADRYFTLINIILITAFVGISTDTMYKVVTRTMVNETVQTAPRVERRSRNATTMRPKSLASYNFVSKRDLFELAVPVDPAKNASLDLDGLEKTDLQLTLWGTIAGGGPNAWAVIEEKKTRKQSLYKVGDVIENATLTHVLRNKVVLNLNGKDQILEIKDEPNKGGRIPARPSRRMAEPSADDGPAKKITVERSMIDESLRDINKLMKDVRIRPHFKNGEPDGLIVSGIRGDSVFKKLGLRNGDIIMGVDGKQIESVDDAMKLYGGLKNMDNMKVEIKRRGRLQSLDFEIQ